MHVLPYAFWLILSSFVAYNYHFYNWVKDWKISRLYAQAGQHVRLLSLFSS